MEADKISKVIVMLEAMRKRPLMYIGVRDVQAAECFLAGLGMGYHIFSGGDLPDFEEVKKRVISERGWEVTNTPPSKEMRERGMDDEVIVDEVIAMEIEVWRRMKHYCGADA
jgi:hypothetical protein